MVKRTDYSQDTKTLGRYFEDSSSDRIQVILAVIRFLRGEKGDGEEFNVWFLAIRMCASEHLH